MKPHIYRWDGRWWVSRNGRASFRQGITMNDTWSVTLDLAFDTADMAWWKASP